MSCGFSLFGCGLLGTFGQTFQLGLIGNEMLDGVGLSHYVLSELKREQTQLAVDFFQTLFGCGLQVGSALDEVVVGHLGEAHLLGGEVKRLALVVHRLDAGKEGFVEQDIVGVLAQKKGEFFCQHVHVVVAFGLQQFEEEESEVLQLFSAAVKRCNRVLERRRFFAGGDGVHFFCGFFDSRIESRTVVLQFDFVEGRNAIGRVLLGKQRVFLGFVAGNKGHHHCAED